MKDNFSKQSKEYAHYRPDYPNELYEFILPLVTHKHNAWDCATGNGQAAIVLARYFQKVYASDMSQKQLDNAKRASNIEYSKSPAETTGFENSFFDLITVAQAAHWFNFDLFYKEVQRVSSPSCIIAIWGYGLIKISPEIDHHITHFYVNTIGKYWDAERKFIDDSYKTLPFPFEEIKSPEFSIKENWTRRHLEGYLNTWSSVQKFIEHRAYNPVNKFMMEINKIWKKEELKAAIFPVFQKIGKVK